MGLRDVTRAGVLAAVDECLQLGREPFRRRYGFGRANTYELVLDGHLYDSKAIAGVAHLYSVGDLLSADDFSGGARTVAHRLRALGFTVKDGSDVTDEPRQVAPQIVLQPRGGPRDRGPRNFAKSVRQGVQIAEIRDALGEQADVLTALYPDGIARLWGATPTTQANNEKARALRNRRVGDDVLFYAENHFIARARILHLFDSLAVAREVWGTDEENATWEHIMALGEVEEFPTPVFAAPILRRLSARVPLRSLTLRSAEDYLRVAELLPERRRPALPRPAAPRPAPSPQLTAEDLLVRIGSLETRRGSGNETPSRHQPLALLWAISRIAAGKPRLAPWSSFRTEVSPLLSAFGLSSSKATPEDPFWHLQDSGLWEVHGVPSDAGPDPQAGIFDTVQPVAGLTRASAELLQNPLTRLEAVVKLCSTHLDDIDQRELLSRAGLAGYATADGMLDGDEGDGGQEAADTERTTGPTERRESTASRLVRNAAIAAQVKELHGHACQICETRLQYKRRPYSEAAHIRGLGSPHDGPDELPNLLCLCPNHHVLFDGLEIYIDVDGIVRRTQEGDALGRLRRHVDHEINETYLHYHRTLCELHSLTRK
ncbi:HNH endonuclease [Streptomyces sp. NBC_00286]|uniref:HNH endonuclease n=1 Tax=Streptomyces sp. NBC_00286 TaxID=2975701 RepID=UPI002E2AD269|nr:HNH endonuclease [Streptomyces sp. NBC_00286]